MKSLQPLRIGIFGCISILAEARLTRRGLLSSVLFALVALTSLQAQDSTRNVSEIRLDIAKEKERVGNKKVFLDTARYPFDSVKNRLQYLSDSLAKYHPNLVASRLQQSLADSISRIKKSAEQRILGLTGRADSIAKGERHRFDSLQDKVLKITNTPSAGGNPDISRLSPDKAAALIEGKSVAPLETVGAHSVPSLNVPEAEMGALSSMDTKIALPDNPVKLEVKQLTEQPDDILKEASSEVEVVTEGLADVKNAGSVANTVEKDIESVKEGDADKLSAQAEKRVTELKPVSAVTAEMNEAVAERTKYETLVQRYRDEKLTREEISRKVKGIANAQIAEQSDKVHQAQKELANAGRAKSAAEKVKAIFAKRSTELEGKKFFQRLEPGLTWQIYPREVVAVDFALQAGYRISPRLTTGIGIQYRIGINKDYNFYVSGLDTYGARLYLDGTITKGVFAHGEFEAMQVGKKAMPASVDPIGIRSYGSYFGLGKRMGITRNLRGMIVGLYRVNYEGDLPSVNKVTARFGIEYIFRRPRRVLKIER